MIDINDLTNFYKNTYNIIPLVPTHLCRYMYHSQYTTFKNEMKRGKNTLFSQAKWGPHFVRVGYSINSKLWEQKPCLKLLSHDKVYVEERDIRKRIWDTNLKSSTKYFGKPVFKIEKNK
jgi:hypothetical protein